MAPAFVERELFKKKLRAPSFPHLIRGSILAFKIQRAALAKITRLFKLIIKKKQQIENAKRIGKVRRRPRDREIL